jgi:archaellum component FlaC
MILSYVLLAILFPSLYVARKARLKKQSLAYRIELDKHNYESDKTYFLKKMERDKTAEQYQQILEAVYNQGKKEEAAKATAHANLWRGRTEYLEDQLGIVESDLEAAEDLAYITQRELREANERNENLAEAVDKADKDATWYRDLYNQQSDLINELVNVDLAHEYLLKAVQLGQTHQTSKQYLAALDQHIKEYEDVLCLEFKHHAACVDAVRHLRNDLEAQCTHIVPEERPEEEMYLGFIRLRANPKFTINGYFSIDPVLMQFKYYGTEGNKTIPQLINMCDCSDYELTSQSDFEV